jgi:hypothetical protein
MSMFTALLVLAAALSADLIIEVSAEISADTLLDGDAGVGSPVVPGMPTQMVDLTPGVTIYWSK